MTDQQIIEAYWHRDEAAIRETAAKYGAYCRSIARGLLANAQDEEECVSDTWIRAWNAMPDERPNRLKLFLGKITRRLACDVLRSRTAQKRGGGVYVEALEELGECVSGRTSVEDEVENQRVEAAIDDFLWSLGAEKRTVFIRRYWYFDSIEHICRHTGYSPSKVKSMLYHTRQKLRDYLESEGFEL